MKGRSIIIDGSVDNMTVKIENTTNLYIIVILTERESHRGYVTIIDCDRGDGKSVQLGENRHISFLDWNDEKTIKIIGPKENYTKKLNKTDYCYMTVLTYGDGEERYPKQATTLTSIIPTTTTTTSMTTITKISSPAKKVQLTSFFSERFSDNNLNFYNIRDLKVLSESKITIYPEYFTKTNKTETIVPVLLTKI